MKIAFKYKLKKNYSNKNYDFLIKIHFYFDSNKYLLINKVINIEINTNAIFFHIF